MLAPEGDAGVVELTEARYDFTTIHVPNGVIVRPGPDNRGVLELRATGDIVIGGAIDVWEEPEAQASR